MTSGESTLAGKKNKEAFCQWAMGSVSSQKLVKRQIPAMDEENYVEHDTVVTRR
jgi:hypothetical protein